MDIPIINIEDNIDLFQKGLEKNKGRLPDERYASFDYCFNYFQSFREQGRIKSLSYPENLEMSCLQLGFYLASWGMLRGSSFLLEKSAKHLSDLIKEIARFEPKIWQIDADNYEVGNHIDLLMEFKSKAAEALGSNSNPTDTLITKIMLGVFGNVPAFDNYFKNAFKISTFNIKTLEKVAIYYKENQDLIDQNSELITTFDFKTGENTGRHYTKAKIIDMIGFIEGYKQALEIKKNKLKNK